MNSIQPAKLRLTTLALLVASTLLFVIGVAAERSSNLPQTSSSSASSDSSGPVEGAGSEASGHQDSGSSTAESGLAGLNPEAIPAVVAAVLVSAAVGVGLFFWWRRRLSLSWQCSSQPGSLCWTCAR